MSRLPYTQLPSAPPSAPPSALPAAPPSAPFLPEVEMDKAALFEHQQRQQQEQQLQGAAHASVYPTPPPPYSVKPLPPQPYPPQPQPGYAQPYAAPGFPPPQPVAPPGTVIMMQPPAPVPAPAPAPSVIVVGAQVALPPGACAVCRRGKIESSASCCTICWCLLLLPWGILPGIIAYFCCCRKPKCTNCGYSP